MRTHATAVYIILCMHIYTPVDIRYWVFYIICSRTHLSVDVYIYIYRYVHFVFFSFCLFLHIDRERETWRKLLSVSESERRIAVGLS